MMITISIEVKSNRKYLIKNFIAYLSEKRIQYKDYIYEKSKILNLIKNFSHEINITNIHI